MAFARTKKCPRKGVTAGNSQNANFQRKNVLKPCGYTTFLHFRKMQKNVEFSHLDREQRGFCSPRELRIGCQRSTAIVRINRVRRTNQIRPKPSYGEIWVPELSVTSFAKKPSPARNSKVEAFPPVYLLEACDFYALGSYSGTSSWGPGLGVWLNFFRQQRPFLAKKCSFTYCRPTTKPLRHHLFKKGDAVKC